MKIKFEQFLNEQYEDDPFGEEMPSSETNFVINILQKLGMTFIFDDELTMDGWPDVDVIVDNNTWDDVDHNEISFRDELKMNEFLEELEKYPQRKYDIRKAHPIIKFKFLVNLKKL